MLKGNVQYIYDKGCPTRCMQHGLVEAKGDWVMFAWDNGLFTPGSIDSIFTILGTHWFDKNYAVSCRYIEGSSQQSKDYMSQKMYYHINHHMEAKSQYIPDRYFLFNLGVVARETILRFGGLDCRFEAPSMALVDLSIRMQNGGVNMLLQRMVAFNEDWNPDAKGTHGPIHDAMVNNDMPLYKEIWRSPECKERSIIPADNWKQSPEVWERRFSKLEKN